MKRKSIKILKSDIDIINWDESINKILEWSKHNSSKYVCIVSSHSLVSSRINRKINNALNKSDMCTPDGMPVAWLISYLTGKKQERINGPDLMSKYLSIAEIKQESIFLLGGSEETLNKLVQKIKEKYPRLEIAGHFSPSFKPLSIRENREIIDMINHSKAGTVWIGLGHPKQELWMAEHSKHINATLIGVGAAFNFHAGTIRRAPLWMQKFGFEWFYRMIQEPRLINRYVL